MIFFGQTGCMIFVLPERLGDFFGLRGCVTFFLAQEVAFWVEMLRAFFKKRGCAIFFDQGGCSIFIWHKRLCDFLLARDVG